MSGRNYDWGFGNNRGHIYGSLNAHLIDKEKYTTISTTPRKIISMDGSYNSFNFPELDSIQYEPPVVAITTVFSEVLTFDDEGNETGTETISTEIEIRDEDFIQEQEVIFLYRDVDNNRDYYSIHQDYTPEILAQGYYVPAELVTMKGMRAI